MKRPYQVHFNNETVYTHLTYHFIFLHIYKKQSGGAALGFYHVGVVKALMENNLMPRVIGGSSAGGILCSMLGTRTDEECFQDMFQAKGTNAPGHSGIISFNFFRPMPSRRQSAGQNVIQESDYNNGNHHHHHPTHSHTRDGSSGSSGGGGGASTTLGQVYSNTAGAFQDPKRTWQVFVPNGLRTMTSFLYDVFTGHRRAGDILMNDTNHFRGVCKRNIGNFTFQVSSNKVSNDR